MLSRTAATLGYTWAGSRGKPRRRRAIGHSQPDMDTDTPACAGFRGWRQEGRLEAIPGRIQTEELAEMEATACLASLDVAADFAQESELRLDGARVSHSHTLHRLEV